MLKNKKNILLFILLILSGPTYAWNAVGHEVVASIAYDHLTPQAKQKIDHLTELLDHQHRSGYVRFVIIATWADFIRGHDINAFNSWHYIDQPYSPDGTKTHPAATQNAVWAIDQARTIIQSRKSTDYEKAVFLRFLIHIVGDIHQPLHCISRYNAQYPEGDKGGRLVPIQSKAAENLHAYWDRGMGLFYRINPYRLRTVSQIARDIEKEQGNNMSEVNDLDPQSWAQESYQLAKNHAYKINSSTTPAAQYTQKGHTIITHQITLAAYRLANILNQAF